MEGINNLQISYIEEENGQLSLFNTDLVKRVEVSEPEKNCSLVPFIVFVRQEINHLNKVKEEFQKYEIVESITDEMTRYLLAAAEYKNFL